MDWRRPWVLLVVIAAIAGVVTVRFAPRLVPGLRAPGAPAPAQLPSLDRAVAWRGSAPLPADSLRGRPVALLVWEDTDPRSLAALAVADGWHRAFAPFGARVIAVHSPSLDIGADSAVALGIRARGGYVLPMADDIAGFVEGALGGPTDGPHLVVADGEGRAVVDTVNDMAAGEAALRALVRAAHPGAPLPPALDTSLPQDVRTVELAAGRVPEGPLRGLSAGHERVFTAEFRYQEAGKPWVPYPVGGWKPTAHGLISTRGGAANFVAIRYSADRAGVVVTPPPGASARLWILRDDRWPREQERGEDAAVDGRGAVFVTVTEPRLYWIDRGEGERVLKLSPETAGVTVNAFVFTGAR